MCGIGNREHVFGKIDVFFPSSFLVDSDDRDFNFGASCGQLNLLVVIPETPSFMCAACFEPFSCENDDSLGRAVPRQKRYRRALQSSLWWFV